MRPCAPYVTYIIKALLIDSVLNYLTSSPVFFVFLEAFIVFDAVLMFIGVPDNIDGPLVGTVGLAFIALSIYLFSGYETIIFVLGMIGVGLDYVLDTGVRKTRNSINFGKLINSCI